MPRIVASLLIFAAFAVAPPASSATHITTVPTDLIPGQSYRLAFVTSTTRDATSSAILDYNNFVAAVAAGVPELVALGTTWTAIASAGGIDARDNTLTNPLVSVGDPIYLLNDTRIANDNADLWDGILASPLSVTETLALVSFPDVWTGTRSDGISDPFKTLGLSDPTTGQAYTVGSTWVNDSTSPATFTTSLYAVSGELTVIPEPSTMMLVCIGATAVVGWQLRRRRHRKT